MLPEGVRAAIHWASNFIWGPWTIFLLLGTGLFLTIRLRLVQITHLGEALRTLIPREKTGAGGVLSPFQTFMTALAATIGTGNIAGVATAIVTGGPGALFWLWCYGFFATAIKFCEAVLGIKYRVVGERLSAGPMHYIREGLGMPWLGWTYALCAGVGAITTTPFTQPNSIALAQQSVFGVKTWVTGVVVAVLAWLVIVGGIKSIGRAAEKLSPLKVILYLGGGLIVLVTHAGDIPAAFALIFREAFSTAAVTGGAAGTVMMNAMRYGLARGAYANEAGYGTAAVVYGTARTDDPAQQGLNAVMEVFIISFFTSTISGLSILVTGAWRSGQTSTPAVAQAFDASFPGGGAIVAICVFLFGYTTLIGWSYYGEQFFDYLFGPRVIVPYRWIYCGLIVFGAISKVETVWAWGDLMNGFQIFPNLVGIIGLSGVAAATLRDRPKAAAAA
jgi:AGCS family alanine or glycine:cation symporter